MLLCNAFSKHNRQTYSISKTLCVLCYLIYQYKFASHDIYQPAVAQKFTSIHPLGLFHVNGIAPYLADFESVSPKHVLATPRSHRLYFSRLTIIHGSGKQRIPDVLRDLVVRLLRIAPVLVLAPIDVAVEDKVPAHGFNDAQVGWGDC